MSVYQYVTRGELESVIAKIALDIRKLEKDIVDLSLVVMEMQMDEEAKQNE